MGVIYKIEPEIKDFILENKKTDFNISCRKLSALVLDKFQVKLSKSSVNSIIKEFGLSMPVGRRQKKKRRRLGVVRPIIIKPLEEPQLEKPVEVLALPEKPIEPEAPAVEEIKEKPAEISLQPQLLPEPEPPPVEKTEEKLVEKPVEKPPEPEPPVEKLPEPEPPPVEKTEEKPVEIPVEIPAQIAVEINPSTSSLDFARDDPERAKRVEGPLRIDTESGVFFPRPKGQGLNAAECIKAEAEEPEEKESPCSGAILLKAADYLLGGSYYLSEAVKNRLARQESGLLIKTEGLIYTRLFQLYEQAGVKDFSSLRSLLNKEINLEDLISYLIELKEVKAINIDLARIISTLFQEVRCVKAALANAGVFYLDGQLHTIWSSPHTPYAFSSTPYNVKSYINKYFQQDQPLVLFMAPGFDTPTKEFFDFMLSFKIAEKRISRLTLYGNKFEEIDRITIEENPNRSFVFGLWPWQYTGCRQVSMPGDFRPFSFEALKENFQIADAEVELLQPATRQRVKFKGCVLKKSPNDKARLIILTSLSPEQSKAEELASLYLSHWPNIEEAFQDFSRKIELFTYTANSQHFFSTEQLDLSKELAQDTSALLDNYLKILDLYVRCHFLPAGYEEKDFTTINQDFYSLKALLKREKNHIAVIFQHPPAYPFLKDLTYACRRINEREITFSDGKRLWLTA